MRSTNSVLYLLRAMYRAGAWVFDHSGRFAPALAGIGYTVHHRLFPHGFFTNVLNPIPLEGLRMYHDGRPSYHVQMLAMGMHDREVVRLLKECVTPGMQIVDVGAHLGYFSLLSASLAGRGGTVWAFEPSPAMVGILRKNIAANGLERQIHVVPQAVSHARGTATFCIDATESMLSGVRPDAGTSDERAMAPQPHSPAPARWGVEIHRGGMHDARRLGGAAELAVGRSHQNGHRGAGEIGVGGHGGTRPPQSAAEVDH